MLHGGLTLLAETDQGLRHLTLLLNRAVLVAPETKAFGSVMSVAFSPDAAQEFMYVADGANHKIWIYKRETLELLGNYPGLGSGRGGGQMLVIHTMGVDSKVVAASMCCMAIIAAASESHAARSGSIASNVTCRASSDM